MKMYDRVTVLNDDPDKNMLGVVVGTATYCIDSGDISHYGGDAGTIRTQMVVRLELRDQGWMNTDEDGENGSSYISHLIVDEECLEPAPWFVNVYEEDMGYGGPEEGGWYYHISEPVHSEKFATQHEAEAYKERISDEYPVEGDRPIHSVLYSGGAHSIRIENHPPVAQPPSRPHYE
jgi:hypothetical protein